MSQLPEDIAGPAPDVEHPSRRSARRPRQGPRRGRRSGDTPPQPARLIPGRALIKRPHVTVIRHGRVWHGDRYDVTYPAAHACEPDAGIKNGFHPSPPSRRSCKQGRWSMARAPVRGWTDHDRGPPGRRGGTNQIPRTAQSRSARSGEGVLSSRLTWITRPGLRSPLTPWPGTETGCSASTRTRWSARSASTTGIATRTDGELRRRIVAEQGDL